MKVRSAVRALLDDLEGIATDYDEFTDTDVREALHRTLTRYFVWGQEREALPICFGMRSKNGDARVRAAVGRFLEAVAGEADIAVGQARLDILQDKSVRAAGGMQYDELFGHRDVPLSLEALPKHMFTEGHYDE
jgi:hypothetical protein